MGSVVLNPRNQSVDDLYLYAHCQAAHPGGVTVLAINAGTTARELDARMRGERYTLSAARPDSPTVQLNGHTLEAADGGLPPLTGTHLPAGRTSLPAASITFLVFPDAQNQSCR
jgi:hypothetical protein